MKTDRLLAIADMLTALPTRSTEAPDTPRFDMRHWSIHEPNHCGTSACAIGHAILAGLLPDLVMVDDRFKTPRLLETVQDIVLYGRLVKIMSRAVYDRTPGAVGGPHSENYVAAALGIDLGEARWLFYSSYYENEPDLTPGVVAARIRRFVRQGGVD